MAIISFHFFSFNIHAQRFSSTPTFLKNYFSFLSANDNVQTRKKYMATTLERSQMMKFKLCGSSHDRGILNSYIQNIVRQHRFFVLVFWMMQKRQWLL
jgi:hypothetical protein